MNYAVHEMTVADEVPEGWTRQPLSRLCAEATDRMDPSSLSDNLASHYVGLEHVGQGTGRLEGCGSVADVVSQKSRFRSGDILYGKLRPNLRKVARPSFAGVCSTDIIVLRSKARADPDFLFQVLQSEPLVAHAVATAAGTKMPRTHARSILSFEIAVPPLDEQRRIAEVLRSVDEAIAASQATLQQSDATLSGLSDELFSATLSEDDSGWPQHPLEDMLGNIIDYRGVPPPKADSGIPLLTAKNVRFGYLDFEPREYIAEQDYDSWMRRGIPTAGDIMFTTEAPLGNVAEFPDIKAALGQRTLTLVPKARALDAKFLKWLLLSKPAQALIWSHATGSTAKGIKQRTFRKLKFGFPALDEQVRIAELLEDIGAARDVAKLCSEAYAAMKAHLLSDLLSGHVRVLV